jgi:hypothetical protein
VRWLGAASALGRVMLTSNPPIRITPVPAICVGLSVYGSTTQPRTTATSGVM